MNDTRKLLALFPVLGVLSCAIYAVKWVTQEQRATPYCQSNLKQVGLGFMQYARDYDEQNPLAGNWKTALWPYTKSTQIFECPSANGYSFNRYLSGINYSQVTDNTGTPGVFDSTSSKPNASDFGTSYVVKGAHMIWKKGRGTNVLFFDGHVKWMQVKPAFKVSNPPKTSPPLNFFPLPKPKSKAASSPKAARAR